MKERREEFLNAVTHGAGIVVFLVLTPFLLLYTQNQRRTIWPVLVYAICLAVMYINSTLYHSTTQVEKKKVFRTIDHISIFLLIGGTFTPIVYYNMGDWNGLPFLLGFWIVMALGIVFKIFFTGRFKLVSTLIYIGVAWFGAIFSWPLLQNMSWQIILCVIAGGLFYTSGTIFYMQKNKPFRHAIWHLFVLAGSLWHFFAIRFSI
jgi:hemolysin III